MSRSSAPCRRPEQAVSHHLQERQVQRVRPDGGPPRSPPGSRARWPMFPPSAPGNGDRRVEPHRPGLRRQRRLEQHPARPSKASDPKCVASFPATKSPAGHYGPQKGSPKSSKSFRSMLCRAAGTHPDRSLLASPSVCKLVRSLYDRCRTRSAANRPSSSRILPVKPLWLRYRSSSPVRRLRATGACQIIDPKVQVPKFGHGTQPHR